MFLCDLTSSFSGGDYPRFCTNGPSSSSSLPSQPSLSSYFFHVMIFQYFAPIDPRRPPVEVILPHDYAILAASHIALEMCFVSWLFRFPNFDCIEVIFTLHWRCILCCEYFLSQTFFALKTRWWCSCVVLNWRIGPWTSQMKICPNVLTVLHWSTKNIARRVFFDCHAMTHRIPLFEYQLSDAQKNMLGHSDQKFDPFNCTPLFLLVLGDVHLWRHHPRGNGQAKYIEWWHNWTGERDIPVYCITPSHCIESRETMSTLGQPTQCLRLKV